MSGRHVQEEAALVVSTTEEAVDAYGAEWGYRHDEAVALAFTAGVRSAQRALTSEGTAGSLDS